MPLKILVADDHPVARAGYKVGLAPYDVHVVAEAEAGDALLGLLERHPCDAVLLDIRLPRLDGLETLAKVRAAYPQLPVVMITGFDNPNFLSRAMGLGAAGYLTKDRSISQLAEVLQRAASGGTSFTREDMRRVTGALATPRLGPEYDVPLTFRECEVLRFLGEGHTNKQIAQQMSISYETVKEHVQHILKKIGVVDRTQAVYWGLRNRIIPLDGESTAGKEPH